MTGPRPIPAFSAYGIEIEYAIVDRESLDVRPLACQLLDGLAAHDRAAGVSGPSPWSNELVAHVVELKNVQPTQRLESLCSAFQEQVRLADATLAPSGARLLPGGMHPWMRPSEETVLWPDDPAGIYAAFDRIFDCRRHGWANLQSMQINLPFADDEQFARLHAAVRLILPLVPALAASSPVVEGRAADYLDYRLEVYRTNASAVPLVSGCIIPETISGSADYRERILEPLYAQIAGRDPSGVLRHEWLNARGAIARFDRNAIEVRLADSQECVIADLAVAAAIAAAVEASYVQTWCGLAAQRALSTAALVDILSSCTKAGERAIIRDPDYLCALGLPSSFCSAADVWRHLIRSCGSRDAAASWWQPTIEALLDRGTLASRILRAIDGDFSRRRLRDVYTELCVCLEHGKAFEPRIGDGRELSPLSPAYGNIP
jgi:glutamate---cysteine ligase / carboxylate-amine ligase